MIAGRPPGTRGPFFAPPLTRCPSPCQATHRLPPTLPRPLGPTPLACLPACPLHDGQRLMDTRSSRKRASHQTRSGANKKAKGAAGSPAPKARAPPRRAPRSAKEAAASPSPPPSGAAGARDPDPAAGPPPACDTEARPSDAPPAPNADEATMAEPPPRTERERDEDDVHDDVHDEEDSDDELLPAGGGDRSREDILAAHLAEAARARGLPGGASASAMQARGPSRLVAASMQREREAECGVTGGTACEVPAADLALPSPHPRPCCASWAVPWPTCFPAGAEAAAG
jgi:hypothetical protein